MEDANSKTQWALDLFNVSPLKQEKLKQINAFLPCLEGKACLDIGSDNGVISLLLRKMGGRWSSADLLEKTVASIKSLVGERVFQIDANNVPFKDGEFDLVVVVDFLEHIEKDSEFAEHLSRILKDNADLIVNVPNPKEGLVRKIRFAIGQTDKQHGHVRAGYTLEDIENLFADNFEVISSQSYSRLFSVLIDTFITAGLEIVKKGGVSSKKGTIVTGADVGKNKKLFLIYKLLFPFIKIFVFLDKLIPFLHGNMLIVKLRKK